MQVILKSGMFSSASSSTKTRENQSSHNTTSLVGQGGLPDNPSPVLPQPSPPPAHHRCLTDCLHLYLSRWLCFVLHNCDYSVNSDIGTLVYSVTALEACIDFIHLISSMAQFFSKEILQRDALFRNL